MGGWRSKRLTDHGQWTCLRHEIAVSCAAQSPGTGAHVKSTPLQQTPRKRTRRDPPLPSWLIGLAWGSVGLAVVVCFGQTTS
jgi:hypothetical protein